MTLDDVKISQLTTVAQPAWADRIVSTTANSLLGFDASKRPQNITIGANLTLVGGVLSATGGGGGGGTPANPTAVVGLTAVNGVATTYMRSDAAPPISQAITPVWTGVHEFISSMGGGGIGINALPSSSPMDPSVPFYIRHHGVDGQQVSLAAHFDISSTLFDNTSITTSLLGDVTNLTNTGGGPGHNVGIIGRAQDTIAGSLQQYGVEGKTIRRGTADSDAAVWGISDYDGTTYTGRMRDVFVGFAEIYNGSPASPIAQGGCRIFKAVNGVGGDSAQRFGFWGDALMKIRTGGDTNYIQIEHDGTDTKIATSTGAIRLYSPSNYVVLQSGIGLVPLTEGTFLGINGFRWAANLTGATTISLVSSVTPANNGELMFEATSNTSLTFKYKGTDSTVRSFSLPLGSTPGTVTTVSVVSANGFAGSVANATTTPAITLTTSITGILKGDGTAISAAVAGDFPTLNQSTTGSAATLTTGRTIAITGDLAYTSPSFNGSANVTAAGTLATVNSNVGSFGSATQVGTFTVNAKGLITAASNTTITPAVGSITGLGTGVATALAVNVGSAGAFITFNGALGTPSSGTVTNLTGTASININGTVGATTQNTGAFTTLTANTNTGAVNALTGAIILASGADTVVARFGVDSFGASPQFVLRRAQGTNASKTKITNGTSIGIVSGFGYDGSVYSGGQANISFNATEDWSGTARGTNIDFTVTTNGTTTVASGLLVSPAGINTPSVTTNTVTTAAPSGASAGVWKLGSLVSGAVTVDLTRSVFIDIGGTVYKLIVAT